MQKQANTENQSIGLPALAFQSRLADRDDPVPATQQSRRDRVQVRQNATEPQHFEVVPQNQVTGELRRNAPVP